MTQDIHTSYMIIYGERRTVLEHIIINRERIIYTDLYTSMNRITPAGGFSVIGVDDLYLCNCCYFANVRTKIQPSSRQGRIDFAKPHEICRNENKNKTLGIQTRLDLEARNTSVRYFMKHADAEKKNTECNWLATLRVLCINALRIMK